MNVKEIMEDMAPEEVIHSIAVDYVDDMLAQLSDEERYSEKGDILRYILQRN